MNRNTTSWQKQSKQAESVIARHGISAWLLFLCAMLMSFLSIYTLTLSSTASKLARNWEATITQSATLRITPSTNSPENASEIAKNIFATTPGITEFEEIENDDQLTLLSPWLGDEIPADLLALPQIFAITVDTNIFDEEGLVLRVQTELPSAIWDNHQRWRGPLLDIAERLKLLSNVSTFIIGLAFVFLLFVSAEASMFSNATSISLLRQIGAEDRWISNGFIRKFVLRTTFGACAGVILGTISTLGFLGGSSNNDEMLSVVSFDLSQIYRAIFVILAAAIIGYASTRYATFRYLKKVS